MRKLFLASAALAAFALAGAASAQDITVGNNGYQQVNNANQVGVVLLPNISVGQLLTIDNLAAGNSGTFNASADINVTELRQTNNAGSLAASVLVNSTADRLDSSTRAFGNAASLTAVNDDIRISNAAGTGLRQTNNADQLAGTLVLNSTVPGTSDVLTAAVGNTLSTSSGRVEAYSQNSGNGQFNNGTQVAGTVVYGSTLRGDSAITSQALGNNAAFNASADFQSHFGQTNNAGQFGLTVVSNSAFGTADIGSAALGNNLSITAGQVNQISPFQTNNAGQVSATYIGNSSFTGSLVAGAGAIGNNITVTTR